MKRHKTNSRGEISKPQFAGQRSSNEKLMSALVSAQPNAFGQEVTLSVRRNLYCRCYLKRENETNGTLFKRIIMKKPSPRQVVESWMKNVIKESSPIPPLIMRGTQPINFRSFMTNLAVAVGLSSEPMQADIRLTTIEECAGYLERLANGMKKSTNISNRSVKSNNQFDYFMIAAERLRKLK